MRAVYGSAVAVLPKLQDDFLCWFEAHFEHGDLADHRIGIMAWIPDDNEMIHFMLKWSGLAGFHIGTQIFRYTVGSATGCRRHRT